MKSIWTTVGSGILLPVDSTGEASVGEAMTFNESVIPQEVKDSWNQPHHIDACTICGAPVIHADASPVPCAEWVAERAKANHDPAYVAAIRGCSIKEAQQVIAGYSMR